MMKRCSPSYKMRQQLSDITNSQSHEEELNILHEFGSEHNRNVNRIIKQENAELIKLLEERDKTIEVSRYELRNLRQGIYKLQMQNLSLAQTNNQFLAEINLARNKVKALQHEVTCKNALLKAKCCIEETFLDQEDRNTQRRNVSTTENSLTSSTDEEWKKPSLPNRRRFIRSKSFGASAAHNIDAKNAKSEGKRTHSRRKPTRARRTATPEVTESSLFEIEDLQLTLPIDTCQQEKPTPTPSHTQKKDKEEEEFRRRDVFTRPRDHKVGRSPINRLVSSILR